jgi:hypothetical protein
MVGVEIVDDSKKLIKEEVNWTPNTKIIAISLSTNESFLAKQLFNDNNDNSCEVFKGHHFENIQDKFIILSLQNVRNLIASFKQHSGGGYIDNILELKSKNHHNFIRDI